MSNKIFNVIGHEARWNLEKGEGKITLYLQDVDIDQAPFWVFSRAESFNAAMLVLAAAESAQFDQQTGELLSFDRQEIHLPTDG